MSSVSFAGAALSWIDVGNPFSPKPFGSATAGAPRRFMAPMMDGPLRTSLYTSSKFGPIGYATVGHTGTMKVAGTDYAEWYGVGYFNQTAPDAALKTAAPSKIVFDDKKEEHRVYMPQDKKNRGGRGRGQAPPKPNDKSGGGQAPSTTGSDDDSDHPTLKRRTSDDSGQTTSSPSSGDDSDRPTLKRRTDE